jgi:hypothetical protein
MVLKLLKGIWFLSMLIALAALLYVYASLPQEVIVQDEIGSRVLLSNDGVFYIVMALMAITNVLVFVMAKVFKKEEDLRTWFYGLITTLNVFFVIGLNLISLYNSGEQFDYKRIDFILYGSLGLIILWALSWPVYFFLKRIKSKLSV